MIGNPEGRRPLGSPKHRWKNKIKTDIKQNGME
jgi:hypothetical protein